LKVWDTILSTKSKLVWARDWGIHREGYSVLFMHTCIQFSLKMIVDKLSQLLPTCGISQTTFPDTLFGCCYQHFPVWNYQVCHFKVNV